MTRRETTEQVRKMREFEKDATSSKRRAIAILKAAGIMNNSGAIKRRYKKALKSAP